LLEQLTQKSMKYSNSHNATGKDLSSPHSFTITCSRCKWRQTPIFCGALLVIFHASVRGQTLTWTTDDFQLAPGFNANSGAYHALGFNQNGYLFNVGFATNANRTSPAVIRTQTIASGDIQDLATNEFQLSGSSVNAWKAFASGAVSGAQQNVFVGGLTTDKYGQHWMVNESEDGGMTWSTIEKFQYVSGLGAYCSGLAADGASTLYGAGSALLSSSKKSSSEWFVQKGSLGFGGQWSWTSVDTVSGSGGAISVAVLPSTSPSTVFVCGSVSTAWLTRRSTDGGSTWATVDTVANDASANSVTLDSRGNVIVVGYALDQADFSLHWTVRLSPDAGTTWAAIYSTPGRAFAVTTVPRTDGSSLPDDIYVSGDQNVPGCCTTWIVRKLAASLSSQGTISWTATVLDNFQLDTGRDASGWGGIAFLPSSRALCVSGVASDMNFVEHWITRTAALP
jgi:hypothetical protein